MNLSLLKNDCLLDGGCPALQGAEIIGGVDRHSDKRVIVLVVEQAANHFIGADVQKADPLVGICKDTKRQRQ